MLVIHFLIEDIEDSSIHFLTTLPQHHHLARLGQDNRVQHPNVVNNYHLLNALGCGLYRVKSMQLRLSYLSFGDLVVVVVRVEDINILA